MGKHIDEEVNHDGKGPNRITTCKHCGGKMSSQAKERWRMHMRQCVSAPDDVRNAYPTLKRRTFHSSHDGTNATDSHAVSPHVPFKKQTAPPITQPRPTPSVALPPQLAHKRPSHAPTAPSTTTTSTTLHSGLSHPAMRAWTEPTLHASQLIYPLFITGRPDDNPIRGLEPNVQWGNRDKYASLVAHLEGLVAKGLSSVMLFGVVDNKDASGCMADDPSTPVIEVMAVLRAALPSLLLSCDVCMCEYTDHGHCGLLKPSPHGGEDIIDNAATVSRLGAIALAYARAGAHMVCPSDMMDNRIGVIRAKLNAHGFAHVSIMAYTSKKASCMYAPFRDAVESTFKGDRQRYQHPVGSLSHALLAYDRDVAEGADTVIVKPSLFYTDIVRALSDKKLVPVACYVVSGEYKMLKDYGDSTGSMDAVVREAHLSLVRAGANILITYFTPFILNRVAGW
ncbi:hypothetical protein DYB34_004072 [Aphanomyces astaci]|uniref:Delta-aminolevulinic acid dehydratase n=1 Tax=Aphanomyces astaci TaxID=112090 RepID=A0A418BNN1_APHAT|nr:hypothetical protein DYB34_004072 [Aphanomyces astaci]